MPQSLEPKPKPFHRVLVAFLYLALVFLAGYGAYSVATGGRTDLLSPSEIHAALKGHLEKSRQTLLSQADKMRDILVELREIRDAKRAEVGLDNSASSVLSQEEMAYRQAAMRPLDNVNFVQVYDTIRDIEQDMRTVYREFVAAKQMQLGRALTYDESYEQAATPRPGRPDLDPKVIFRDIYSIKPGQGRDAFLRALRDSKAEVAGMVDNAEKLLTFTRNEGKATGDGISADLSGADRAWIGYRGEELMPDEMDFTFSPDTGNFRALPGRRLVTGGQTDEWIYVDTWYIIGPFPGDRRRENLDVRFGPEASVNLDDVFIGKDNRRLHWEYKKVGFNLARAGEKRAYWKIEPRNVTSYGIWYAYTEIYSDVPRENVWIATATDDYGKLWINDKLVWKSPKTRKPYNATENLQAISLKQGQNKILYRVENAGGTMGFSLVMKVAREGN